MEDRIIYMNNAATAWPKPSGVIDAVTDCISNPVYEQGLDNDERDDQKEKLCQCRNIKMSFYRVS